MEMEVPASTARFASVTTHAEGNTVRHDEVLDAGDKELLDADDTELLDA